MVEVEVSVDVTLVVEERDGYWSATTDPFALTAYGTSAEHAEERAKDALLFLFKNLSMDADTEEKLREQLTVYLNAHGIKHSIRSNSETPKEYKAYTVTRELQVLAGAG